MDFAGLANSGLSRGAAFGDILDTRGPFALGTDDRAALRLHARPADGHVCAMACGLFPPWSLLCK